MPAGVIAVSLTFFFFLCSACSPASSIAIQASEKSMLANLRCVRRRKAMSSGSTRSCKRQDESDKCCNRGRDASAATPSAVSVSHWSKSMADTAQKEEKENSKKVSAYTVRLYTNMTLTGKRTCQRWQRFQRMAQLIRGVIVAAQPKRLQATRRKCLVCTRQINKCQLR